MIIDRRIQEMYDDAFMLKWKCSICNEYTLRVHKHNYAVCIEGHELTDESEIYNIIKKTKPNGVFTD